MKITNGDKTIYIPGWALLVGALILDNVICNICKVKTYKKYADNVEKLTKIGES